MIFQYINNKSLIQKISLVFLFASAILIILFHNPFSGYVCESYGERDIAEIYTLKDANELYIKDCSYISKKPLVSWLGYLSNTISSLVALFLIGLVLTKVDFSGCVPEDSLPK